MDDYSLSIEWLKSELIKYNLSFDDNQLRRLFEYQDILLKKNKQLNLTRIDSWDKSTILNILDSLLLYPAFADTEGEFLDIGTGAGLPGIPLAIVTNRRGTLMDSVKKKIAAVDEFIDELNLSSQLTTTTYRAEEFAKNNRHRYGCVVARAVAQSDVLMEYARPFLPINGSLILAKANISGEEANNASIAASRLGYKLVSRETFDLPNECGHRTVLSYLAYKPSTLKLPRKVGEAKRKPISMM